MNRLDEVLDDRELSWSTKAIYAYIVDKGDKVISFEDLMGASSSLEDSNGVNVAVFDLFQAGYIGIRQLDS